ncbi:MAG TPA: LacI family DNA-binding transcriptional regulator [Armatimonadota bacterium]|mgnify:FL=1|nr:LacI family DNA-binding transcriptional regulator [Armatimonadota bacterium]
MAARARVSTATVSAALQPDAESSSVSPETRQRVLAAAEELGYDYARLRPRSTRPTTVAVFTAGNVHPNVSALSYAILLELGERFAHHGIRMVVESGHGPGSRRPDAAADMLRRGDVDAGIVIALWDWARHMRSWGAPSVFLGAAPSDAGICQVCVDDELGGRLVAEHLWSLGHRRVGVVHMSSDGWGADRERGFRSVWSQKGLSLADRCCVSLPSTTETSAVETVRRVLTASEDQDGPVTALFCDADWVAAHAIRTLQSDGYKVPDDISVVGFDDAPFATMLSPQLTTVRQPIPELSALAAALVVEQMSLGAPMAKSYTLPCELVVRGTTAPPAGV